MRRPIVLLSLLLPLAMGFSQAETQFAKKLKALKAEYQQAQNKFFADYQKIKGEKAQMEFYTKNNPSGKFVDKAVALAQSAGNDPAGPQGYEFAISVLQGSGKADVLKKLGREAIEKYAKKGGLNGFVTQLGYGYPFEKPEAVAMLENVLKITESEPMRIAATASMARLHKGWGEPKPEDEPIARKYLNELIAKWPKSREAESAKGDLYELDNLRTGKVFPDFETTDQDGKTWKLSDYRGKVVVIDFWGYW